MKILLDTNVVLDVLLAREGYVKAAADIFSRIERSELKGYLCATTVTTIDYLLTRSLSRTKARELLHRMLELFEIAVVNRSVIEEALKGKQTDFEDAVLVQSAVLAGVDAVITRNIKDFRKAPIKVHDPAEFLALINSRS